MLAGKQFKLIKASVAIDVDDVSRSAVTIPADAIVEVLSGQTDDYGFVDVVWEGRTLAMFAIGLSARYALPQNATARGLPVRVGR